MEPKGSADRGVIRRIDGSIRTTEIRRRDPPKEGLLATLDADPAGVVENHHADRHPEHRERRQLLHGLQEIAVPADRQDLLIRLG